MANNLTKPELMALNQAIVALIKNVVEEEVTKASSQFNKGDIVSFADNNNIRRNGVITKRNQKTESERRFRYSHTIRNANIENGTN